jgi:hypothetical protein
MGIKVQKYHPITKKEHACPIKMNAIDFIDQSIIRST